VIDWLFYALFILTLGAGLCVIRGFTPHAMVKDEDVTYRLSAGISLVIIAYVARGFYWGVAPAIVNVAGPSLWDRWYEMTGTSVNLLFTAVMLRGLFHLLVLLLLLIPEEERGNWSIWSAPFYPTGRIVIRTADLRARIRKPKPGKDAG
jgi:hypothetical protein